MSVLLSQDTIDSIFTYLYPEPLPWLDVEAMKEAVIEDLNLLSEELPEAEDPELFTVAVASEVITIIGRYVFPPGLKGEVVMSPNARDVIYTLIEEEIQQLQGSSAHISRQ